MSSHHNSDLERLPCPEDVPLPLRRAYPLPTPTPRQLLIDTAFLLVCLFWKFYGKRMKQTGFYVCFLHLTHFGGSVTLQHAHQQFITFKFFIVFCLAFFYLFTIIWTWRLWKIVLWTLLYKSFFHFSSVKHLKIEWMHHASGLCCTFQEPIPVFFIHG